MSVKEKPCKAGPSRPKACPVCSQDYQPLVLLQLLGIFRWRCSVCHNVSDAEKDPAR